MSEPITQQAGGKDFDPAKLAGAYWPLAVVIAAFFVLFRGTIAAMALRWEDPTFSHGWIVAPAAVVLAWVKRDSLRGIPVRPAFSGMLVILVGLVITALALWIDVRFIPFLSMLVVVAGIIVYLYGWPWLKALGFPYGFLFFMVPWPDFLIEVISFPLQILTSAYSAVLAAIIGVPVVSQGVNLYLMRPDGSVKASFEVAVACSGMRSLVALMCLASVFAYFTEVALWKRWLLFLLGIPMAFIANIIRVFAILCVGNWISPEIASKAFHDWSSPVLFLINTLGLIALRNAMLRQPKPMPAGAPGSAIGAKEDEDAF